MLYRRGESPDRRPGLEDPTTNRETFQVLREEGVLTAEQASAMEGWAGLRNVLVHLYLEVDHERLFRIVSDELDPLEAYAVVIASVDDAS